MRYAFYPGCAHDTAAGYKESLGAVCRKLDMDLVEIPDWNCCGATITAGQDKTQSLYLCARTFAQSEQMGFTTVLTGCNACYTTLKKSANTIFSDEDCLNQMNQLLTADNLILSNPVEVRHVMDVIFNDIPPKIWESFQDPKLRAVKIACYYGCQYSRPWIEGRESEQPRVMEKFLSKLGFDAVDHGAKTLCCGAAGAMPGKEIAQTLVGRIVSAVASKNADAAVTICPLCQFNVDSLQVRPDLPKMPVLFFTQLLGLYLNIDPDKLGLKKLLNPPARLLAKFKQIENRS